MEEMYGIASNVQYRWKQGSVAHFDVVESFSGRFSESIKFFRFVHEDPLASAEHNIVKGYWFGLSAVVRNQRVLKTCTRCFTNNMILYATGGDLWLKDHMDGAFSVAHHPKCEHLCII
jgi:hypothetical protein